MDENRPVCRDALSPIGEYFADTTVCPSVEIVDQLIQTGIMCVDEIQLVEEVNEELKSTGASQLYTAMLMFELGRESAKYRDYDSVTVTQ